MHNKYVNVVNKGSLNLFTRTYYIRRLYLTDDNGFFFLYLPGSHSRLHLITYSDSPDCITRAGSDYNLLAVGTDSIGGTGIQSVAVLSNLIGKSNSRAAGRFII